MSAAARTCRPAPGSLPEPSAAELDPAAGTGWSQHGARLWVRDADALRWIGAAPPPPDWAPEPVENVEVEAARTDVAATLHRAGSDPWRAPLNAPVPEDVPWMRISGHRIDRSRRGVVAYITMPYAPSTAVRPPEGLPAAVPVDDPAWRLAAYGMEVLPEDDVTGRSPVPAVAADG